LATMGDMGETHGTAMFLSAEVTSVREVSGVET